MTIHYDSNLELWIGVHDTHPLMISGPTKEDVLARLQEYADRYQTIQPLSEPDTEDIA